MRLAVVCPLWPPMPGGLADYTARWTEAMVEAGCTAVVLTGPGAKASADPRLRVVPGRTAWGRGAAAALADEVAALRPDAVVLQYVPHLYERRGLAGGIVRAAGAIAARGLPVVTSAHELYYGRHEALRHQPIGLYQRLILRPLFAASRRVAFTTPDREARMRAVFPGLAGRTAMIPVGANLFVPPDADRAAWRLAHGVPADAFAMLFQGGLHPSKEVGSVVAALDALPGARLVMIGGGRLDHPRAIVLGHLDDRTAGEALAACDLAVTPFDDGASGRRGSVLNALGAGLPVVSTRGGNTDPALFTDEALRLVAPGDAAAFAAAVVALAGDPAARAAMGAAGKALHDAHFAWPVLAGRWKALLEGLGQS